MSAPDAVRPAFVGRARETALAEHRVTAAAAGRGGLLLIAGEPGIGKSSLADVVTRLAADRGLRVVWGRCRETDGAPAFWPWTQVLRGLDGADAVLGAQAAGAERFQQFDAVTTVLLDRARAGPLLVVLDDLHRADDPSLRLLGFLVPALPEAPLLVVGTFRDTEAGPPHPLAGLVGDAAGRGVDLVTLGGLTAAESAQLVAASAPGSPLDADELRRRCGGNPFFMTELLRLGAAAGEQVPATVSAALAARVARLPEPTRQVLVPAAVLGRSFTPARVARLASASGRDSTAPDVETGLEPAVAGGLVVPDFEGGYRFTHVLVREALYEAVPAPQRAALHDRAVTELDGDPTVAPADLASHAARTVRTSAGRERALRLAVRAAADARDRLAHEEAATWFGRAVDLGPGSDEERFDLLLELGGSAGRAGDTIRSRDAHERAWALASAAGWDGRLADVALGLGAHVDSAGTVDAGLVRMLEEALARVRPADRTARIRLSARLAAEVYWGPRLAESRRLAADAVAAARRLGDAGTLAVALAARQYTARGPGDVDERIRIGEELAALARSLDDPQLEIQARRLLLAERMQRDPAAADAEMNILDDLARSTRRPLARWYVLVNQGMRETMAGHTDAALAVVAETEALGRRIGVRPATMYAAAQRYFLRREAGRGSDSEDELRAAANGFPRLATLRAGLTLLLAEAGRRDEAEASLAPLVADDCRAVPPDALWLSTLGQLALAAARLGATAEAESLYRLLAPHSGEIVFQGLVVWWGAVDHHLGVLAAALGRDDDAHQLLRNGLRLHERWGAVPLVRASLAALDRLGCAPDLTAREREVLALVAAGAANKEIARSLRISVHTVERHVANVYAKIGARNRAEATAFVLRTRR